MVKYELRRPKRQNVPNFIMVGYDFKAVKKSELKNHLENGWVLVRKRYFIITPFLDWWKQLSDGNKIAVIAGIVVPISIAIIFKDSINIIVPANSPTELKSNPANSLNKDIKNQSMIDSLKIKENVQETEMTLDSTKVSQTKKNNVE